MGLFDKDNDSFNPFEPEDFGEDDDEFDGDDFSAEDDFEEIDEDDFDGDDEFDEGGLDLYGEVGMDGLDIPDLPEVVKDLIEQGALGALDDLSVSHEAESEAEVSRNRVVSIETIFETHLHETVPGLSRGLLSAGRRGNRSFGTAVCQSLTIDLKKYSDRLLFGLLDNIYLHTARSITYNFDRICTSVRFYWDEEESPFKLVIPNASCINDNPELVYLLVGDLLEELVDGIEESTKRSRSGDAGGHGNGNSGGVHSGDGKQTEQG